MQITSLLSLESLLGRLDYESLSDQALLEMLVDGWTEVDKEYTQCTR